MKDLEKRMSAAVKHFWKSRIGQSTRIGKKSDQGTRGAVTGGKQMDAFAMLIREVLIEAGAPKESIFLGQSGTKGELPGYFRPEKRWDLFVVVKGRLLTAIELKSQVGSFGNNYNNRVEESIGNATDLWTAYREKAFPVEARPWLGYLMLLEDAKRGQSPVAVREPHFPVFPPFRGASYAMRYRETITRLLLERLYDGACFILSPNEKSGGLKGIYNEPDPALTLERFVRGMASAVKNHLQTL